MTKNSPDTDYSKKPFAVYGQIFATFLISIVGLVFTVVNSRDEEKSRKSNMATQLMANREISETNFRQTMFLPLIKQIFDDSLSIEKRFTTFEIFQDNFNDLFNSRALFDVLRKKAMQLIATKEDTIVAPEVLKNLVSLARQTNVKQILAIANKKYTYIVKVNSTIDTSFTDQKEEEEGFEKITIHVDTIKEDRILMRMKLMYVNNIKKDTTIIEANNGRAFHVEYFDSPLTDNTIMPDGDRIAVVLEDIMPDDKPDSAKITIIHFPADIVTAGYRPSITRVHNLINGNE